MPIIYVYPIEIMGGVNHYLTPGVTHIRLKTERIINELIVWSIIHLLINQLVVCAGDWMDRGVEGLKWREAGDLSGVGLITFYQTFFIYICMNRK